MKIYGTFLDVMEAVFTFISRNLYVIEVILLSKEVIKGRLITVDWAYEASVQCDQKPWEWGFGLVLAKEATIGLRLSFTEV